MKVVRETSPDTRVIVVGDLHGSFATFVRHLVRWRLQTVLDDRGVLAPNYHLVFLGDIIDRGIYGYELLMVVYMLKLRNPERVHVNRGNHEDHNLSSNMGDNRSLYSQMQVKFGSAQDCDDIYG